mmetsp:Transcript_39412/g.61438  ORF Transcript_39412/g.61438 Transcript_39412/m.61438 type:complete len:148 (-) Transcript_39412:101-544(-)
MASSSVLRIMTLLVLSTTVAADMVTSLSSDDLRSGMTERGRRIRKTSMLEGASPVRTASSDERYPSPGGRSLSWRFDLHHALDTSFVAPPVLELSKKAEHVKGLKELRDYGAEDAKLSDSQAEGAQGSPSLRQKSLESDLSSLPVRV